MRKIMEFSRKKNNQFYFEKRSMVHWNLQNCGTIKLVAQVLLKHQISMLHGFLDYKYVIIKNFHSLIRQQKWDLKNLELWNEKCVKILDKKFPLKCKIRQQMV